MILFPDIHLHDWCLVVLNQYSPQVKQIRGGMCPVFTLPPLPHDPPLRYMDYTATSFSPSLSIHPTLSLSNSFLKSGMPFWHTLWLWTVNAPFGIFIIVILMRMWSFKLYLKDLGTCLEVYHYIVITSSTHIYPCGHTWPTYSLLKGWQNAAMSSELTVLDVWSEFNCSLANSKYLEMRSR